MGHHGAPEGQPATGRPYCWVRGEPVSDEQGVVYASFIDDQLQAEQARRLSVDDRAAKLLQTVVVLTGLFVTAAGLLKTDGPTPSGVVPWLLAATCGAMAAAFVLGMMAARLVEYEAADGVTLGRMVDERWTDGAVDSRNITAFLNMRSAMTLRAGNNFKARMLTWGQAALGVSVALGATSVVVVLLDG